MVRPYMILMLQAAAKRCAGFAGPLMLPSESIILFSDFGVLLAGRQL